MKSIVTALATLGFLLFCFEALTGCENSSTRQSSVAHAYNTELYSQYFLYQNKQVALLDSAAKSLREKSLEKLKASAVYKAIVVEKKVSAVYLPALHMLSEAIRGSEREIFLVPESAFYTVDSAGQDFALEAMALTFKGGFSKELVEGFERYRLKYGYYGEGGRIVEPDGTRGEYVIASYDLTPIFALIDPANPRVANSIHEAASKGIFSWEDTTRKKYPHLVNRRAYNAYLKDVDPSSLYILRYDLESTAPELFAAYNENEVAADRVFQNNRILVTGVARSIKKDALGKSYIMLDGRALIGGVHCTMSSEDEAASVSKGYQYTLAGRCEGMVLSSVVLSDCVLYSE